MLVCKTDDACIGFPLAGGISSLDGEPIEAANMTCYKGGETVFNNHQMCDVTSKSAACVTRSCVPNLTCTQQIERLLTCCQDARRRLRLAAIGRTTHVRFSSGLHRSNRSIAHWRNAALRISLDMTRTLRYMLARKSSAAVSQDDSFVERMVVLVSGIFVLVHNQLDHFLRYW